MASSISTTISLPPRCRHFSLRRRSLSITKPRALEQPSQFHLATSILVLRIDSSRRTPGVSARAKNMDFSSVSLKPPGRALETDRLPSDVRRRALDDVGSLGGRVTICDVASKVGLKLDEAQKALQALATDTDGFLEVSNEGDVLYVYPRDYRSKLATKSIRMKLEPFLEKTKWQVFILNPPSSSPCQPSCSASTNAVELYPSLIVTKRACHLLPGEGMLCSSFKNMCLLV